MGNVQSGSGQELLGTLMETINYYGVCVYVCVYSGRKIQHLFC